MTYHINNSTCRTSVEKEANWLVEHTTITYSNYIAGEYIKTTSDTTGWVKVPMSTATLGFTILNVKFTKMAKLENFIGKHINLGLIQSLSASVLEE